MRVRHLPSAVPICGLGAANWQRQRLTPPRPPTTRLGLGADQPVTSCRSCVRVAPDVDYADVAGNKADGACHGYRHVVLEQRTEEATPDAIDHKTGNACCPAWHMMERYADGTHSYRSADAAGNQVGGACNGCRHVVLEPQMGSSKHRRRQVVSRLGVHVAHPYA